MSDATGITIGIHLHTEPERLDATLIRIQRYTASAYDVLLLPDGPDEPTAAALARLGGLKQSGTTNPCGVAACFNRLARETAARLVVLLESGSLVGPGWLEYLQAALETDPYNGLAGPSTNDCWNEQCVYRQSGNGDGEIERTSGEAASRFAGEVRRLYPLYSLADFCYVVRREVIDAIGAADEGYGLGPCWEMDYNVRAERAGFHGVWACSAYVHRLPMTHRRRLQEAVRFEASKQRYQDAFCGARLRGSRSKYRAHCSGDACPNFAPPPLIDLYRPLRPDGPATSTGTRPHAIEAPSSPLNVWRSNDRPPAPTDPPLVTCIMPTTADRRAFVPQAIRSFLRQDYPHCELLVLDDGATPVAYCVPSHDRIRYLRLDGKRTIGAKRNLACEQARGDLIVHWDDDDWYPPTRVSRQVRAMIDGDADVCGSSSLFFYDPSVDRAWEYRYEGGGVSWVAGTTLAYRRRFWQAHRFPEIQVGEDAQFIWSGKGAKVCDLRDSTLSIAMVHSANTSAKQTDGCFWHAQPPAKIHAMLGDDLWFYRMGRTASPLVSCIMPTYNRRSLVPMAVELFRHQDYPARELIVVDDGHDPVGDLVRGVEGVRYFHLPSRRPIGAKRNFACQHAQGEIIAHWDDDDWYSPDRLRYQIAPIVAQQADITGLDSAYTLDVPSGSFWTTRPELHQRMFAGDVHGGTLVYSKSLLAAGIKYPDIDLAEDAWLLQLSLQRGKRLRRLANPGVFVYVRHGRNTWKECAPGTFLSPAGWERIAPPPLFPADALASYRIATAAI
jgi:O-antigen biosynthesis protein